LLGGGFILNGVVCRKVIGNSKPMAPLGTKPARQALKFILRNILPPASRGGACHRR